MTNTITLLMPDGKKAELSYSNMAEVQMALLKIGCGNIADEKVRTRNKQIKLEVPSNTPKNRQSELETMVKSFGLGEVIFTEDSEWESGGLGSKVDWSKDEPLIHRGVDITKAEDCEAVREVIKMFQNAADAWKELKEQKIVGVDGNFHIKTLAKYRKTRKQ